MSISALSAGLSGLRSNQRALDSSANNIANSQTPNYQGQRLSFQEGAQGGVSVAALDPGQKGGGQDLAADIVDQVSYSSSYQVSAKVVQAADDTLGTLINITA